MKRLLFGFALLFAVRIFAVPTLPTIPSGVFNITNYGAVSSTTLTNTTAIQNAIKAAGAAGGGTVEIPAGTFLSGPVSLTNNLRFQIDGGAVLRMLPITSYPGGTNSSLDFLTGDGLHDVEISGSGAIDGQGLPWWQLVGSNMPVSRPIMLSFQPCTRLLIQNVTLSNPPAAHIAIKGKGGHVTIQNVTFRAPSSGAAEPSHNTDAIDLAETNCLIQNCDISVGDDNVAVGSSGGLSADIVITNLACGDGHGISIGSYTSSGVSNMTVINCTFTNTDQGIRIKSDRDRGGVVQNIAYYNLTMVNVMRPILIYCQYTNTTAIYRALDSISPAIAASYPSAPVTSKTPIFRNITISNVVGTAQSTRAAGLIWGLPEMQISNVILAKVTLTGSKTFGIYDAQNVTMLDSQVNVPTGVKEVSVFSAGLLLTNSLPSANNVTFDGVSTNGINNTFQLYNALASIQPTNALDIDPFLSLGSSTLIISNHLNLSSGAVINFILSTNAATITVRSNLQLGATLNVTNGSGFGLGSYTLFTYGGSYSGSPVLGTRPSTPPSYLYSLSTATPGQVKLIVSQPPSPIIGNTAVTGTNIVISGSGGVSNLTYYVLTSTNMAVPLNQWSRLTTNQFDASGNFIFSNSFSPSAPLRFFLLQYP